MTQLRIRTRTAELVRGIGFSIAPGERVALLGASGSGKSVTAAAILGVLDPALQATGTLELSGRRVEWSAPPRHRRGLGAVFQDSRAALNPLVTVGSQVADASRRAGDPDPLGRVLSLLSDLGFDDPERVAAAHSGSLSGGQRQRACLALALAARPTVLIADEPTTALDTLSQAEVITALRGQTGADGPALLFITHDIAVASHLCSRALVLAHGEIVESSSLPTLLAEPQHEYSRQLIDAARREVAVLSGDVA